MAAAGIRVDRVVAAGTSVRFDASTTTQTAPCPACGQSARRVHSRYVRWLDDLGVSGRQVRIRLQVRRWRCDTADCARKIFAEQPDGLTGRYQRRIPLLAATLGQIGLALGGRAGERLTSHLAAPVSRMTLLRLVRGLPQPVVEAAALRVVGVDEFAFRRGHTYGTVLTVLVDMQTRRPVDLRADRAADTWPSGSRATPRSRSSAATAPAPMPTAPPAGRCKPPRSPTVGSCSTTSLTWSNTSSSATAARCARIRIARMVMALIPPTPRTRSPSPWARGAGRSRPASDTPRSTSWPTAA